MSRLIYLATPYNHASPTIRKERFEVACVVASRLMREGHLIFCPIAHTHPIAMAGDLPKGWQFWAAYDEAMLSACGELWIVMMPGWGESEGIKGEIEIATTLGIPIRFIEPHEGAPTISPSTTSSESGS